MGQLFFGRLMSGTVPGADYPTYIDSLYHALFYPVFAFGLTALAVFFLKPQAAQHKPG